MGWPPHCTINVKSHSFFSHYWLELNGKSKWKTLFEELTNPTKEKENNDGTSSHQSIGLDDDNDQGGGVAGLEASQRGVCT